MFRVVKKRTGHSIKIMLVPTDKKMAHLGSLVGVFDNEVSHLVAAEIAADVARVAAMATVDLLRAMGELPEIEEDEEESI